MSMTREEYETEILSHLAANNASAAAANLAALSNDRVRDIYNLMVTSGIIPERPVFVARAGALEELNA